ncbi:hypothetical protein GUJ93_ZPchr0013g35356 [Zizania palustris]|uniref:Pentatricopeptide repeat-containing protein n=1 Tax=Zizania palustris TaxID=103762 RepID=A0A8J5X022_ZIZPA|nr:hypothetical protein GUJ93_ZPchr0013g35356 [Zizania palustris]
MPIFFAVCSLHAIFIHKLTIRAHMQVSIFSYCQSYPFFFSPPLSSSLPSPPLPSRATTAAGCSHGAHLHHRHLVVLPLQPALPDCQELLQAKEPWQSEAHGAGTGEHHWGREPPLLLDFATVCREFSRHDDWQCSLQMFKYMQHQSWCRPDEHIHVIVIGVLGRQGPALLDKCLEVFYDLPSESRTVLSYMSLIAAYAHNMLHEEAHELLDQMKAMGGAPTAATYNTVLAAYAHATDPPAAVAR